MTATDPRDGWVALVDVMRDQRDEARAQVETLREKLSAIARTTAWEGPDGTHATWSHWAAQAAAALAQVPPSSTDFPGQPSGRGDTITTVSPVDACPCCGSAVRVHAADEGTCSYEPAVSAAAIETVREALQAELDEREAEIRLLTDGMPLAKVEDYLSGPYVRRLREALAALPPKADGPTSEPRIRTIGDLTQAMTEAGLEPPDECA